MTFNILIFTNLFLFLVPKKIENKNTRVMWELANVHAAVGDGIMYKMSEKQASIKDYVPRETLRRHLKKARSGEGTRPEASFIYGRRGGARSYYIRHRSKAFWSHAL